MNNKQKKQYIKRHVDNEIIDIETARYIYRIIRDNEGIKPIRNVKNKENDGVFIDLNKVSDLSIDRIYNIVQKRVSNIVMN
uniref:NET domain-containing protein n=1 Tax=viral metagenome TaxID=1070528 RepID=A0A6C0LML1_9ZZZZ